MADFLGLRINLIHLQQHHTISPRFVCRYLSYAIVQLHPRSPRRLTRRIFFALFSKTILIRLCKAYFYACFLLTTIPLVVHCHVTSVHFSPPLLPSTSLPFHRERNSYSYLSCWFLRWFFFLHAGDAVGLRRTPPITNLFILLLDMV